jgi:CDP-diacylglycerol--glycerol-3-phosphate 3-phosphatidyltransferase
MSRLHDRLRALVPWLLRPVLDLLIRGRVHPNAITTVGFLVTVSAGIAFFFGHVRIGGALVLLGGFFDVLDGQVARESGLASAFGSFYDSTLDRMSEIVVFLGIFSLYGGGHPDFPYPWMVYTVALALAGSLMISYTRARAESLGLDCKVGLMQRPERVVLIGGSALVFGGSWEGAVLTWVLLIMAALTNFTAVQRIVWVYRHTRPVPPVEPRTARRPSLKITPQSHSKP